MSIGRSLDKVVFKHSNEKARIMIWATRSTLLLLGAEFRKVAKHTSVPLLRLVGSKKACVETAFLMYIHHQEGES